MTENGIILKGIGGFYYVDTAAGLVECKARGKFRIQGGKPVIGDQVVVQMQEDGTGYIMSMEPRRTELLRPAVANIDQLLVVCSQAPPSTEPFLIDKITAIAANKNMDAVIVINKTDLDPGDRFYHIYSRAGFTVYRVSAETGAGLDQLREQLRGHISAFAGNSGVGKSSLVNALYPEFHVEVGEISRKIERGRHTTRHVELLPLPGGGYLADTPGFSAFNTEKMDLVFKDELQYAFREFQPYLDQCQFTGCAHVKEKGCAVRAAVSRGEIAEERHDSYCKLYESVKDIKEWSRNK